MWGGQLEVAGPMDYNKADRMSIHDVLDPYLSYRIDQWFAHIYVKSDAWLYPDLEVSLMGLITGQFNEAFTPILDGVTNVVKNYTYWLNRKYGISYVITPHFPNYIDKEDYEVIRYYSFSVPRRPPYRVGVPAFDIQFMRKIRDIPFDLVHAHCPFSSGRIALSTARRRGIPVIATFHSKYYDDLRESLRFEGAARIGVSMIVDFYNSVDYVWTVNNGTAGTLREYGYKGPIEIVNNGTEFESSCDKDAEADFVNRKLGLKPNDLVFLFVGQLIWQKNIKTLTEALAELKAMDLDYKMLFVGMGYAEEELKDMVEELNISDRVLFLGSIQDRSYLKSLFCRANLLLFPSIYDNASIVVNEAASQKCPSLLIEGSNTAEGIVDGFNGFLTKDSPRAIANRIYDASSKREYLARIGENAYKTVYKNWESIVDEVYGRYTEIVKAYRRIRGRSHVL
jgi:1,2-diacylglycerol 3-alpha-glucosyltransferase